MIVRATGTAGPIGASYAISAADWNVKSAGRRIVQMRRSA